MERSTLTLQVRTRERRRVLGKLCEIDVRCEGFRLEKKFKNGCR